MKNLTLTFLPKLFLRSQYRNWKTTPVYLELAVSASYDRTFSKLQIKHWWNFLRGLSSKKIASASYQMFNPRSAKDDKEIVTPSTLLMSKSLCRCWDTTRLSDSTTISDEITFCSTLFRHPETLRDKSQCDIYFCASRASVVLILLHTGTLRWAQMRRLKAQMWWFKRKHEDFIAEKYAD